MSRKLIDAKWLKTRFEDLCDDREIEYNEWLGDADSPNPKVSELEGEVNGIFDCIKLIDKMIANHSIDAVEVVRCKNCDCYLKDKKWCAYHGIDMKPNDYCKYCEIEN